MRITFTLPLFLILLCPLVTLRGQVSSVEFGKNRVQFHQDYDEWSQYESRNFITYWYGEGRYIGQSVVQMAEYDFESIESILEHRMNDKIEIIVYTDLTDLKQSNIGSEEAFENIGGQTKIVGNKMFVYFNGDHNDLRRQIREGVASVYMNAMLFGSNLQEIVQNAVMMNLPAWFKDGLISFVGQDWNTGLDNQLRDIFLSDKYEEFEDFAEANPALAGHSLWYFISQNFGKATVSNLLYLTRINRSVESGFLYVLGSSFDKTTESWQSYFKQRYLGETRNMEPAEGQPIEFKNKRNLPITLVKLSPDGQKVAYVVNEIGKFKLYIQEISSGKRTLVMKQGFRNAFQATDYNYPLFAWNPGGMELAVIYEVRDVIKLLKYDIYTGEKVVEDMSTQYQRIYSIDYLNNFDLVLTAAVRGFSDLFLYFTQTRQTQRITNDFWDDLDARVVNLRGKRGIVFASNRSDSLLLPTKLDSILPIATFDLFYYDLEGRPGELVRLTHTPHANERQPAALDTTYFSYLSDVSGIDNRFQGYLEDYIHHYDKVVRMQDGTEVVMEPDSALTTKLDSAAIAQIDTIEIVPVIKQRGVTFPVTNRDRNILMQHTAPRAGREVELVLRDGSHRILFQPIEATGQAVVPRATFYREKMRDYHQRLSLQEETKSKPPAPPSPVLIEKEQKSIDLSDVPQEKQDTGKIDIDNYLFQSEFDEEEVPAQVIVEEDEGEITLQRPEPEYVAPENLQAEQEEGLEEFRPGRIIPYRIKFRTDFVTTQLDNSLLFDGLNSFAGTPQDFGYPPPGILLKANFKDLFEDYELEGGIRIPTTFNGTEYFLVFDDKKKRLDKRYAAYRRALRFSEEGSISSPIQPKTESVVFLTQFQLRYPLDIFTSIRATTTLRFDNTVPLATSPVTLEDPILREQRLGLRLEYVFDNTLDVALNIKNGTRYKVFAEAVKRFDLQVTDGLSLGFNDGFMAVVGFDARHYQRLLKYSIFAARFAGATSFGSEKILYYLGGVDNWLLPRFNDDIPTPISGDFAYQTVAANMRGFRLNIRNGNSYALVNTELRVPIFRYFSKNLNSNFLRNFQLVGFFDMGTAWQGLTPFTDENPLNTKFIPDPPVPSNPVTVKVRFFRDPIVVGYGGGVRALLFGYFLRVDYAWGIETRVVQEPRLYVSLGLDF